MYFFFFSITSIFCDWFNGNLAVLIKDDWQKITNDVNRLIVKLFLKSSSHFNWTAFDGEIGTDRAQGRIWIYSIDAHRSNNW